MPPIRKEGLQRWAMYGLLTGGLLGACVGVLLLHHYYFHHEFMLHLAAIPLEILLGAVLVERFLSWHTKTKKRQQLMYIKSYFFRTEMRKVFILNFRVLKKPVISIEHIARASAAELRTFRKGLAEPQYGAPAELEPILDAYVESRGVFQGFLEWAISNDFEGIFRNMIDLLHFIEDIRLFKSQNPGKLFAEEAMRNPHSAKRMYGVLREGVSKFLDYAIELKEKQPKVFAELMNDYEISARMFETGTKDSQEHARVAL